MYAETSVCCELLVSVAGIPGCEMSKLSARQGHTAEAFCPHPSLGRTRQLPQRIRQWPVLRFAFRPCKHSRDDSLPVRLFLLVCLDHVLGNRESLPPTTVLPCFHKSWYSQIMNLHFSGFASRCKRSLPIHRFPFLVDLCRGRSSPPDFCLVTDLCGRACRFCFLEWAAHVVRGILVCSPPCRIDACWFR